MGIKSTSVLYSVVRCKLKKSPPHGQAHLFFANAKANAQKTKRACPSPPLPIITILTFFVLDTLPVAL